MNEVRKVVFHSATVPRPASDHSGRTRSQPPCRSPHMQRNNVPSGRQEDAQQKFLEKQKRRAVFDYLSIIIMLMILIGALTVLMHQLQAHVPVLISSL
jgi:hypothetical protein